MHPFSKGISNGAHEELGVSLEGEVSQPDLRANPKQKPAN